MTATVTAEELATVLHGLPPDPRVVVSGNFAHPTTALSVFDEALPQWRLWNVVPAAGTCSSTKTGLPGCSAHRRATVFS